MHKLSVSQSSSVGNGDRVYSILGHDGQCYSYFRGEYHVEVVRKGKKVLQRIPECRKNLRAAIDSAIKEAK